MRYDNRAGLQRFIKGLDLADFIDGPLPREIHLDIEMPAANASGTGERAHHFRSGSFRLGHVPFVIQPVDGTDSSSDAEIIATRTLGAIEFRCALTDSDDDGDEADLKPMLTSTPPLAPEAMLARIFHNADPADLDDDTRAKLAGYSEWFRFSEN